MNKVMNSFMLKCLMNGLNKITGSFKTPADNRIQAIVQ